MQQFDRLVEIVRRLRSEQGCPWDRQQTHESLQQYFVEEVYEALEAIETGDWKQLCAELGDVLLHVVMHAQLACEDGEFDISDVLGAINDKLVYRHPHVFGEASVSGAEEVLRRWEQLKRSKGEGARRQSVLDGVPKRLPALQRANRLQEKAARVGFDWEDSSGAWAKIIEELEELQEAVDSENQERISEEIGDVLIAVVNVARLLQVSAERALRAANDRFQGRFRAVEQRATAQGRSVEEMTLAEMDELWEQVKSSEGDAG